VLKEQKFLYIESVEREHSSLRKLLVVFVLQMFLRKQYTLPRPLGEPKSVVKVHSKRSNIHLFGMVKTKNINLIAEELFSTHYFNIVYIVSMIAFLVLLIAKKSFDQGLALDWMYIPLSVMMGYELILHLLKLLDAEKEKPQRIAAALTMLGYLFLICGGFLIFFRYENRITYSYYVLCIPLYLSSGFFSLRRFIKPPKFVRTAGRNEDYVLDVTSHRDFCAMTTTSAYEMVLVFLNIVIPVKLQTNSDTMPWWVICGLFAATQILYPLMKLVYLYYYKGDLVNCYKENLENLENQEKPILKKLKNLENQEKPILKELKDLNNLKKLKETIRKNLENLESQKKPILKNLEDLENQKKPILKDLNNLEKPIFKFVYILFLAITGILLSLNVDDLMSPRFIDILTFVIAIILKVLLIWDYKNFTCLVKVLSIFDRNKVIE
jgi:hypothetical protein